VETEILDIFVSNIILVLSNCQLFDLLKIRDLHRFEALHRW
jgi:hypothetical protein